MCIEQWKAYGVFKCVLLEYIDILINKTMDNLYRFRPEELPLGRTMVLNLAGCFGIALFLWPFLNLDFFVLLLHSVLIGTSAMLLIRFGLPILDRLGLRSFRWESAIRVLFIVVFAILAYLVGSIIARFSLSIPIEPLFEINGFNLASGEENILIATIIAALAMTSFFAIYHRFMSFKLFTIKAKEREEQAKRRAADAQLAMLKAQIEPHMIFNTLATVRALIGTEPENAEKMLDKFIQFLHITLSGSQNPTVDLKTEFAMLENYLSLWKYRLGDRLSFTLLLPEDLANFRIPSLLLQPLVENAVRHGIEPHIDGGEINVVVHQLKNIVTIAIKNTGIAMNDETLQQARSMQITNTNKNSGLGLGQLRSRLQSYYNGCATHRINSKPNEGTTIIIKINAKCSNNDTQLDNAVLSS